MTVRFLTVAQRELDDAFAWYESQSPGLGMTLLNEIDHVIHRISAYPDSCAFIASGLRRAIVNRFPYGVIYGIEHRSIIIVAVAHLHREPSYWCDRW